MCAYEGAISYFELKNMSLAEILILARNIEKINIEKEKIANKHS